jgi:hypothetical protein
MRQVKIQPPRATASTVRAPQRSGLGFYQYKVVWWWWWLCRRMKPSGFIQLHSYMNPWAHVFDLLILLDAMNKSIYNQYESNTSPRVPVPWDLQEFDNQIHPWNSEEVLEEVPHTFTEGEMQFGETFTDCFVKKFLDILLTSVDYCWLLVNLIILIIVGRGFLCVFAGNFLGEIRQAWQLLPTAGGLHRDKLRNYSPLRELLKLLQLKKLKRCLLLTTFDNYIHKFKNIKYIFILTYVNYVFMIFTHGFIKKCG